MTRLHPGPNRVRLITLSGNKVEKVVSVYVSLCGNDTFLIISFVCDWSLSLSPKTSSLLFDILDLSKEC